jgi:hypothetical protein
MLKSSDPQPALPVVLLPASQHLRVAKCTHLKKGCPHGLAAELRTADLTLRTNLDSRVLDRPEGAYHGSNGRQDPLTSLGTFFSGISRHHYATVV